MEPSHIVMLCILLILLLFSAFFSSAETALTTINKVRLRMLVEDGDKRAIILDKVLNNSRKMLSTILIGNNIVNIAASSLTTIFIQSIFNVSWIVSIGVGILTLIIIIFGEIMPKTVASKAWDEGITSGKRGVNFSFRPKTRQPNNFAETSDSVLSLTAPTIAAKERSRSNVLTFIINPP